MLVGLFGRGGRGGRVVLGWQWVACGFCPPLPWGLNPEASSGRRFAPYRGGPPVAGVVFIGFVSHNCVPTDPRRAGITMWEFGF